MLEIKRRLKERQERVRQALQTREQALQAEEIVEDLTENEKAARVFEETGQTKVAEMLRSRNETIVYPELVKAAKTGNRTASRAATMIGRW